MRFSNARPVSIAVVLSVFTVVSILALGSGAPNQTQASSTQAREPVSYRDVVKRVLPAVVSVEATTKPASAGPGKLHWRDDRFLPQDFRKLFEGFAADIDWPEA